MSNVSNIMTGRINLKRYTSFVLDEIAVAGSLSPTRNPARAARLEVTLNGTTVSMGSVTVSGSTQETFSFLQNGSQVGTKDFSSISGITLTGISQGFIKVRAINNMGQPINSEVLVGSDVSVRFFEQRGKIKIHKSGEQQVSNIMIMLNPSQDVQNLDNVYVISGLKGITLAQLDFVEAIYDFEGVTHHIEALLLQP